ncbi:hypothetical protein RDI58_029937 [Solanum bulbocastanum]|uniref:Uncharacterized protein n=1 Tax=Solanum bulbocastanum TaxID=147425 RepID=A0AAN8SYL9_SOLBU
MYTPTYLCLWLWFLAVLSRFPARQRRTMRVLLETMQPKEV